MAPQSVKQPGKELAALFEEVQELWDLEDPLEALPRRLNPNRAKHAMEWPADTTLALLKAARATPHRHEYVVGVLERKMDQRVEAGGINRAPYTIAADLEHIVKVNPARPQDVPPMANQNADHPNAPQEAQNAAARPGRLPRHAKDVANQRMGEATPKRKRKADDEELPQDDEEQDRRKRARAGGDEQIVAPGVLLQAEEAEVNAGGPRLEAREDYMQIDVPLVNLEGEIEAEHAAGRLEGELNGAQPLRPINQQTRDIIIPTDDLLNPALLQQQPIPMGATRPQRIDLLRLLRQRNSHLRANAHDSRADALNIRADTRDGEIDYLIRREEILLEQEQANDNAHQVDVNAQQVNPNAQQED